MEKANKNELEMLKKVRALLEEPKKAELFRLATVAADLTREIDLTDDEAIFLAGRIRKIPSMSENTEFSIHDYVDAVEYYRGDGKNTLDVMKLMKLPDDDFVECVIFMAACKRETYESDGKTSTGDIPVGMKKCWT